MFIQTVTDLCIRCILTTFNKDDDVMMMIPSTQTEVVSTSGSSH